MQIESKIKRAGGTQVKLDDQVYFFGPTEKEARHLCEVTDPAHIERLLSIPEGYAAVEDTVPPPVAPTPRSKRRVRKAPVITAEPQTDGNVAG